MKKLEELKASLIAEVDKRMADKIIEPTNAELLVRLINNAESETEALVIAELGTTYRRTGFHFDKRLEKMGSDIKYLDKNEDLSFVFDENALTHKLIIGDNYEALLNLLISHKGNIDVIYIDPPYAKDSMGEFAETNYENALTRDNLLSMLYPRMILAKQLLSENGIIYCSIDDRNQAYVKCLLDDIFGEENFVCNFVWKKKSGGSNDSDTIVIDNEYIICYTKDIAHVVFNKDKEMEVSTVYNKYDEKVGKRYSLDRLDKQSLGYHESLDFPIIGPDGKEYVVEHKDPNNKVARWRWARDTVETRYDELVFIYPYVYTKNYEKLDGSTPRNLLIEDRFGRTRTGKTDIKEIFNIAPFDFPKPVKLINYLLKISTNENSIVLDFFAGSGTTGQAVLELNREDGGNRQFILCTNNEETKATPNGIAYDVTSKRLKRVMTGCCYDGSSDFKWNENNKPYGDNLEVSEIKKVNNTECRKGKSAFEVIDETLYGLSKFESIEEKINWVCSNFENTQRYIEGE